MKENDQKISFLEAKKALLVNFTGSSYHWGCYGTSMEIYQSFSKALKAYLHCENERSKKLGAILKYS